MSGLDLKAVLFYLPEEVATMFRRTLRDYKVDREGNLIGRPDDPDVWWAYRAGRRFLKPAVRRFGKKQTLFLKAEVDRIVAEGVPTTWKEKKKKVDVNTAKRYNGNVPEGPGTEDQAAGGGTDAETR
jgi:hypothetical protein